MTKIYIAGPMTGIPNFNFEAFFEADEYLHGLGYETFSPAANDIDTVGHDFSREFPTGDVKALTEAYGLSLRECLKADLNWILDEADAMYMLTGWEKSSGALVEHTLAKSLGLPIFYERTL